jgi:spermidine synthase
LVDASPISRLIIRLFFFSGFAAIIYQIVWQRMLYASFGTNIEAITIIVSVFMFGLGLGSLLGGYLSRKYNSSLIQLFVTIEIAIGVFGICSKFLISTVSTAFLNYPDGALPFIIFMLLCIPTLAMGATFPVLVAYIFKSNRSVEESVSKLYYINTLGSAVACFLTIGLLFVFLTLTQVLIFAACINFAVAAISFTYIKKKIR